MRLIHCLLIFAASMAMQSCTSNAAEKAGQAPSAPAPKLPVDVIKAVSSPLRETELISGSVGPNRQVDIMSMVTRRIVSVGFRDGQWVSKGQVLYTLDNLDILARLRQLRAELELAKITEKRLSDLLKSETVRQEDYDAALAKRLSLEAAADLLHVELERTLIRAPFAGRIGISRAHAGALAAPGTPLVTLQEQSVVKLSFSVSEKHVAAVRLGAPVYFSTALGDSMVAVISATEPGLDAQSRTITVHALAKNPSGKLKPGMSAKVFLHLQPKGARAVHIPTQSLIPGASGYSVFLVKSGVARLTPVTLASRNAEEAVVTSGIADGDTVMVSNVLRAMDGTAVEIIKK